MGVCQERRLAVCLTACLVGRGTASRPLARPSMLYFLLLFYTYRNTTMAAPESRFGFVAFAETWNGRMAMLGFVIGLATEVLTGQGILSQIGLG